MRDELKKCIYAAFSVIAVVIFLVNTGVTHYGGSYKTVDAYFQDKYGIGWDEYGLIIICMGQGFTSDTCSKYESSAIPKMIAGNEEEDDKNRLEIQNETSNLWMTQSNGYVRIGDLSVSPIALIVGLVYILWFTFISFVSYRRFRILKQGLTISQTYTSDASLYSNLVVAPITFFLALYLDKNYLCVDVCFLPVASLILAPIISIGYALYTFGKYIESARKVIGVAQSWVKLALFVVTYGILFVISAFVIDISGIILY